MEATVNNFSNAAELLEYLVGNNAPPSTLIVCMKRKDFTDQIIATLVESPRRTMAASQGNLIEDEADAIQTQHALLSTALRILANQKKIKLVFCPSIDTLRAHLSDLARLEVQGPGLRGPTPASTSRPILAILDLVLLHHATSEFSFQGLSRTLACAVEAAARNRMDLLLSEGHDVPELQNRRGRSELWELAIPLLSGSVRIAEQVSEWGGNMVQVKHVAQRWFTFVEKDDLMDEPEEEEMLV